MISPVEYADSAALPASSDGRISKVLSLTEVENPPPNIKALVTVNTAAHLLGVCVAQAYILGYQGKLETTVVKKKPGHTKGLTLVTLDSIEKLKGRGEYGQS